jgi:hypothetical protein
MRLRSILTFVLLAIVALVGCAPATAPDPAQLEASAQTAAPMVEELPTPSPLPPTETVTPVIPTEAPPTEAPTEIPQVVVTSRGPNLEATDPTTVSLNSGDLQFVEFFRFT